MSEQKSIVVRRSVRFDLRRCVGGEERVGARVVQPSDNDRPFVKTSPLNLGFDPVILRTASRERAHKFVAKVKSEVNQVAVQVCAPRASVMQETSIAVKAVNENWVVDVVKYGLRVFPRVAEEKPSPPQILLARCPTLRGILA